MGLDGLISGRKGRGGYFVKGQAERKRERMMKKKER